MKIEPIDAFVSTIGQALDLLDDLKSYMEDHMGYGPDEITWSHVHTAAHIVQLLEEISVFAFGEEEA